jgi:glycopeptide antibiotics resistance protein
MPYFNFHLFKDFLTVGLIVIVIEIFIMIIWRKFSWKQVSTAQFIFRLLFIIYVTIVFFIAFIPNPIRTDGSHATANFIPVIDIYYSFNFRITNLMYEHVLNIIFFIPFGVLFPLAFQNGRRFFVMLKGLIVIVFSIELLQWILPNLNRVFDINDIICNIVGGLGGYAFYTIIDTLIHKKYKVGKKLIVFIPVFIVAIVLPVVSVFTPNYYKINMIDSSMFVPDSIELQATDNWPKSAFLYKPKNTGPIQISTLNGYQGGVSTYGKIRIIDPVDAANRCLSGVILNIYTEGLSRPDSIIINNIELNYAINSDQSLIVPIWCFYGQAVKQISIEDGQYRTERKKAEIFAPAFY